MKKVLMLVLTFCLSGCTLYRSENLTVWGICYDDRKILPNGLYESQEIKLRCRGGHQQLHFRYTIPQHDHTMKPDPLDFKDKLKEFRGD
jgi:hypothetical protein